jgi:hypothetical protein
MVGITTKTLFLLLQFKALKVSSEIPVIKTAKWEFFFYLRKINTGKTMSVKLYAKKNKPIPPKLE